MQGRVLLGFEEILYTLSSIEISTRYFLSEKYLTLSRTQSQFEKIFEIFTSYLFKDDVVSRSYRPTRKRGNVFGRLTSPNFILMRFLRNFSTNFNEIIWFVRTFGPRADCIRMSEYPVIPTVYFFRSFRSCNLFKH